MRIFGKVVLGLFIFIFLLLLFIRSPWGQDIIKDKLVSTISDQTGTKVELDKLFVRFNGNIQIDGLYLEDQNGDTLIYSKSLNASIPFMPLIKGSGIAINSLEWNKVRANIIRKDSLNGFNFDFLVNAFVTPDSLSQPATDTSAAPLNLKLGEFDLSDFKIRYIDDVSGIDALINFEKLLLDLQKTDMENMVFRAKDAELVNSEIRYYQNKPFPESDNEEELPLPVIFVENLKLNSVRGEYVSQPDSLSTKFNIMEFLVENAEMNLQENKIETDLIALSNSDILLEIEDKASANNTFINETEPTEEFQWPEWNIDIGEINLQHNNIAYYLNGGVVKQGEFNPNAVRIDDLILEASNIVYTPGNTSAVITQLNFKEASGIALKEFNLKLEATENQINLEGIRLGINESRLAGDFNIQYKSLKDFLENPGEANLNASLSNVNFQISELYRFQPDLKNNEYISSLATAPISGSMRASGKLDKVNLQSLNLNWRNTRISGSGTIHNLQDPEKLSFNLPNVNLRSSRSDLVRFVKEEDLGVQLPEKLTLTGSFSGNTSAISTNSTLTTSDGNIIVQGDFNLGDQIVFDANIEGENIALGKILQNEALGEIQLNIKTSGKGNSLENLNARLDSKISSFTYNNYEFRDIDIKGELADGKGPLNLIYQDANLDMEAQTLITLDTLSPRIDLTLYMDGADLGELGITQQSIKTGFTLEGWFKGNADAYELNAEIIDGVAVYNNKTFLLGNLKASAFVKPDTTFVNINNRIIDLNLKSNASPAAFTSAINRHFKRYITENYQEDSITNPVNMKLDAQISQSPILNEVFLVNLEEMDTIDIAVDFRENERKLDALISIPYINYYSSEIDSLQISMQSDKTDLNFDFAFNALTAGPLAIKKTELKGVVLNRKLNLDFSSLYDEEQLVHVNSELNFQGDTLKFHVNPQDLILNKNPWEISDNNQISYAPAYLDFQDFRLNRNNQEMQISNNKPGIEKEHLSLDFKNFKLAALLNYLNPEDQLAKGNLNGNLVYEDPFGKTGILADLQINQFEVLDVDLNTLSLKGNSSGFSNYEFEMALKGGEVDMDLTGSYIASEEAANLDMDLDLNEVKMTALEGFSLGEIENGSGSFSGNVKVSGTLAEPQYEGDFQFNNAQFTVAMLNAEFTLADENLQLDNSGLYFDNFNIRDSNSNAFVVNGEITTESFLNPGFNLDLQAENFTLLSSTEEDNDLFYGTAIMDVDAQITGDLNLPKVNADLDIKENTNFTYVVPETELQLKERDGIVIFVNKENPDDLLTQTEEESYVLSGYDIRTRISVNEEAIFSIIINEETGDKFQVTGEGDLFFNMYPNGRTSLTGVYEVNDGFYEMSLYNLVKRRFEIADGSRVSWAGDPFDANLDVRAIYRVETSASSLMASQLSATDPSIAGKYRQELPFLVYLNIDGELMQPTISFNIDMPEDEQGAVGGQVYGRIQQLNNQEPELNKQVFSLLVLNRFFPDSGSDGSSGGTLSVARDNINQALSDQLNALSGKILGNSGVQLNFGLDSYTDYQGENPQDRTQLDVSAQKAFLDDRLIVQVGSEVDIQGGNQNGQGTSPLIGNVSIEYLLNEEGVFRLKGFRKNQYENVIDGQLVVSGIALIFTKEFNKLKNLFEKAVLEEVNKKERKKRETDQNGKDEN